jgi:hypothetical protein
MSLKLSDIDSVRPYCWIAGPHAHDDPTPKLGPATRIDAPHTFRR